MARKIPRWVCVARKVTDKGGVGVMVLDDKGKKVTFGSAANARLAGHAPEMIRILTEVDKDAELWFLMLQSEHPGMVRPAWLDDIGRVVRRAGF